MTRRVIRLNSILWTHRREWNVFWAEAWLCAERLDYLATMRPGDRRIVAINEDRRYEEGHDEPCRKNVPQNEFSASKEAQN